MVFVRAHLGVAITQESQSRQIPVIPALDSSDKLKASIHVFARRAKLFSVEVLENVPDWAASARDIAAKVVASEFNLSINPVPISTAHRPVGDIWKWDDPNAPGHVYQVQAQEAGVTVPLREFFGAGPERFIVHYVVSVYPI